MLVVINSAVAMTVSPGTAGITSVGSTQQLSAAATNNVGGDVPGLTFNWVSSDATVATVSNTGLVKAVAVGTAVITASVGTLSATSTITVTSQLLQPIWLNVIPFHEAQVQKLLGNF